MEAWGKRAKALGISKRDREILKIRSFLSEIGLLEAMEKACLKKQTDLVSLFYKYVEEGVKRDKQKRG